MRRIIIDMGFGGNAKTGEKGQVAVLFALIFTFMFVLFCFVVDFTQLINNKINLQIAADEAAYAGAAWQARILNTIGLINYRMRQDLKEFTMRVWVTHMRHNRNYPHGPGFINGPRNRTNVEPFVCQQSAGYVALTGRLKYSADTNMCRNASPSTGGLPPIVVPPVIAGFDPFAVAVATQIRRIQQKANEECRAAADDNKILSQHLIDVYSRRSLYHLNQINQLSAYLNEVARDNAPKESQHPLVRSAYESAIRNLTQSTSGNNDEDIRFDILQPQGLQYLELIPERIRASLLYINFQVQGDGCIGLPGFIDFENFYSGVYKRKGVLTYFAVKLTAKPKMFFMPSRWVERAFPSLVAISAAKPFGSRVGPGPNTDPLIPNANRPGFNKRMLDFSFLPNDSTGIQNTKMMAFFDRLHPFNSIGRPDGYQETGWPEPTKTTPELKTPLIAIRAPTVFDSLFYTIFPDPKPNSDYLEPRFAQALFPDYMEAVDQDNNYIDLPTPRTAAYFPTGVGARHSGPRYVQINADQTGAGPDYRGYAEESPASHSVTSGMGLPFINNSQEKALEFGFAPPGLIHSAWSPDAKPGRIGYSVKFIPFRALHGNLLVLDYQSGNRVPIINPPTGDPNTRNIFH